MFSVSVWVSVVRRVARLLSLSIFGGRGSGPQTALPVLGSAESPWLRVHTQGSGDGGKGAFSMCANSSVLHTNLTFLKYLSSLCQALNLTCMLI